jgi:nucleoside-diphosphate-sugar epimerase
MKVLLTGAAGFVGSHLTDSLLNSGASVIGVDNFCTGRRVNLEHLRDHPCFTLLEADASEPLLLSKSMLEGLDWVMHFASPASPPKYLAIPIETMRVNAEGSRHLLELCRQTGAKFFLASTSECYGDPEVHPQPESYWGLVNPIGPRSVYDEAKRYAEAITMAYHRHHGVSSRIIRVFNTYGPRMDPDDGRVVTNFIKQALQGQTLTIYGDGAQTRSFQFVSDLIAGIRALMTPEFSEPVNLGNPEEFTMLELATLVQELVGSTLPIEHLPLPQDDPRQRKPDITRARALLGWEPQVRVRDGLARSIEWFRTTGV